MPAVPATPVVPETVEDLRMILVELLSSIAGIDITGSVADTVCLIYAAAHVAQARVDGTYAERFGVHGSGLTAEEFSEWEARDPAAAARCVESDSLERYAA